VSPAQEAKLAPSAATSFGGLYGASLAMREVFAILERVAAADVPVLLVGETGTGKELCAEAIHAHSRRAAGPFVVCDMSAISRSLIESELFGHVRGAFTGADKERAGVFVAADRGTLFIDEIGELDFEQQPRLLRALEQREVRPVGGQSYRRADVRVVAATNRDLAEEVSAGRFRNDLYHRLAVVTVKLPPLRERRGDVAELARRFLEGRPLGLPPETLAVLADYDWPGNVRELKNVIERALALVRDDAELAPALLGLGGANEPPRRWPKVDQPGFFEAKEHLIASWERSYLKGLLDRCSGNVSRAARESGIGRNYLHRLLKKHDLQGSGE
jgi:DNA-binding NtrC family response regulator